MRAWGVVWAVALAWGCSHYSTSTSLPRHIRTVAIPLFENQTVTFDVKEALTDALLSAFIADNVLCVISSVHEADAVIKGTIVEVREAPFTYGESEEASQFRIQVLVDVAFKDLRENEVLWSQERMLGWGTFNSEGADPDGVATRKGAIDAAVDMLVREIVDRSLGNW